MKIVFVVGSPRKMGNTSNIVKAISERLPDTITSEVCFLPDYQIHGCLGCSKCQGVLDDMGCAQQDDAPKLLRTLIEADLIVYATPLYGHSYSGQLKIFMDRHVAMFKFVAGSDKAVNEMEIRSFISDKPVALIVSCQGPEEDNTELIKQQFERFAESSLAKSMGSYIFPWCDPSTKESIYDEITLQQLVNDITAIACSK